jgi:hypothetical protein
MSRKTCALIAVAAIAPFFAWAAAEPPAVNNKDEVERGLPGWGKGGKDTIRAIVVVKQDMTMTYLDAVRYAIDEKSIQQVGGAFTNFVRVPELEPEYDAKGNVVQRRQSRETIQPLYRILVRQVRGNAVFHLTVERGVKESEGGGAAEKTPFATVMLWKSLPDGLFDPYASCTYSPLPKTETPPPVKVLDALYAGATNAVRRAGPE